MCGRFAQYSSRDDYFASLGMKPDEIIYDPEPIGRFKRCSRHQSALAQ